MERIVVVSNAKREHGTGVWIDRRSVLGNPFNVQTHGRLDAIAMYRDWLIERLNEPDSPQLAMLRYLTELSIRPGLGVHLVCHCAPAPCHGDVLAELIEHGFSLDSTTRLLSQIA